MKDGDRDNTIPAVRCERCFTLHDASGDTFVRLSGDVRIGMSGKVILRGEVFGQYLPDGGQMPSYYCKQCFVRRSMNDLGMQDEHDNRVKLVESRIMNINSMQGLFDVAEWETPPRVVFAIIRDPAKRAHDGSCRIEIEQFVRISQVPLELRRQVQEALGLHIEGGSHVTE